MEYSSNEPQLFLIYMLLKFYLTDVFLSFYFISWQLLFENGAMCSNSAEINGTLFIWSLISCNWPHESHSALGSAFMKTQAILTWAFYVQMQRLVSANSHAYNFEDAFREHIGELQTWNKITSSKMSNIFLLQVFN